MELKEAYIFCPRCGKPGESQNNRLHCSSCGLDTYFNPKPATDVALLNSEGKFLFCVRGANPLKGYLDLPGGFVEAGETFEQSARRELKEELGIEIDSLEFLRSSLGDYLFQDINYHVIGNAYFARLPDGAQVVPADDVDNVE